MLVRSAARKIASRHSFLSHSRLASTLSDLLQEAATDIPHREVVRDTCLSLAWSNADLYAQAKALAEGLGELQFGPGSTLVTLLPTDADNLIATLAAANLGVQVVPVPITGATAEVTAGELETLLANTGAQGVYFSPDHAGAIIAEMLPEVCDETLTVCDYKRIQDPRFPKLDMVATTQEENTTNGLINIWDLFMFNSKARSHVELVSGDVTASTPLVSGSTNEDILAAADRVISKLQITGKLPLVIKSKRPEAIAVAAAVALRSHSLLDFNSGDGANVVVIDDSAIA